MFDYYGLMKKFMFNFSPENAHHIAEFFFKNGATYAPFILSPLAEHFFIHDKRLEQTIFGKTFLNPLGLGAGFDKNATMIQMLTALGFGHIEYGTITPEPQNGNAKPRLFRYVEQESIQNAMGFNNEGMYKVGTRLESLYPFATPLGANIGKNKTTTVENALKDYEKLIKRFKDLSDYLVINISSPNTPGLRDLQNEQFIKDLFVMAKELTLKPVLLKIAPDLEINDALHVSSTALENGAAGIVATNTTVDYSLIPNARDFGGLSGKVLTEKSFVMFEALAKEFFGKTTLISVGGIDSADEAYRRLKAGASLIQIYSAFIFKGPSLNRAINLGILERMEKDGFNHISEVIGSDRR
ncbi:quinone-dependent dihydroorotate dehydrogenase [Sulfurospirillum diekertiae]|uniref:Dihydroorotate dehydrogenase (quinone) n=1 Tax=Sulfurospirillum diekertiae TaxID=1854492 RepID=A0A6G9VWZ9_9BACT|nr:quinone-dependent dihydroorotate dehydrogenase [Sulfurospirillum diekertiae]QIR77203.1 quinone-dependent dihydroorotate dehydrogenase [Sulfurospirillum diekertiae]QIR79818.1 quinone-dependent dihydroorotate dehydrogenase [Sulfurospirillum diekertiae]